MSDDIYILRDRGVNDGTCKCGKPGARVYVEHNDNTLGHECDACWDEHDANIEGLRAQAAELRMRGVPEKMVQRIMCARVDRGEYRSEVRQA